LLLVVSIDVIDRLHTTVFFSYIVDLDQTVIGIFRQYQ